MIITQNINNMRTIKFRAWDKKEKEMVDINSLEIYDDLDKDGFYSMGEVLNNEDWEVMQFTGLKDKNGKEIYEGDILDIGWVDQYFEVRFDLISFESGYETFGVGLFGKSGEQEEYYDLNFSGESKIVGNIYENAELLK